MSIVSVVRCETYDVEAVRRSLRAALEPLGGMTAFVSPGQRVLLKPNLLMPVRPERAITTHPSVVEAAVELVREAGGAPFIADSPGGPLHVGVGMKRLYQDTGLQQVADRLGVPLVYECAAIQLSTPDGFLLKRLDLLKACQDADVVLSLAKLKTHGQTVMTGAVKNLFGLVPGLVKSAYHAKLPGTDRFCDMLLDIVACVRPALSVIDGVVGLEGNGPSLGGSPRRVGVLLASPDPVALDAVACRIIGLDPGQLALFRAAERRGWWPVEIQVAGEPVAAVAVPDFRPHIRAYAATRRTRRRWTSWVARRFLVPVPLPRRGRCTACRTCERTCPSQAIRIVNRLAVVDQERCILCYCCHEVCPEAAIDLKLSALGRLVRWTGLLGRQA